MGCLMGGRGELLEMPISMTVLMGPDGEEDAPIDVDIMQ